MRSERYKMIQDLIAGNMFVVTERSHSGNTTFISARIINSMFFQLTPEEIVDGINGYMGCFSILTEIKSEPVGEYVNLEITMKDVHHAKSFDSSSSPETC